MDNLVTLLDIEKKFRYAKTQDEVVILAVNILRNLIAYHSAIGFSYDGGFKPIAYSDTPYINKNTPFIKSLKSKLKKIPMDEGAIMMDTSEFDTELTNQGLKFAMLLPLVKVSDKKLCGAILFFSDTVFNKESKLLAEHCGEVISLAMTGHRKHWIPSLKPNLKAALFILVLAGAMSIRIPMTSQAKAQVVFFKPHIVTAPMNGVIKSVKVKGNDLVKKGDFLLSYDDIEIKGKQRIAAQTINISASEIVKQERNSFFDSGIRNKLEESKADKAVKTLEYQAISAQLNKLTLFAPQSGTVILDDPTSLVGKPVKAGEKLLSIVDPKDVEIEILLPAHETHAVKKGDEVSVFLDNAPFESIKGVIDRVMYEPVLTPSNIVSYKAYVKVNEHSTPPLGICGNAKIYGENTSVFWYIFRRPFAFLRWYFG